MPYVHLVRHAQPDFAGHYDSVTELGLKQSEWLGRHFAARGLQFTRVLSGSLERQVRTLAAMLTELTGAPPPAIDPGFNEYDAASVLAAHAPVDEAALRAAGDRRAYFGAVRDALRAWSEREAPLAGLESWDDFGRRTRKALAEACAGLEPAAHVLVVTSGGVIGRLVADALGAGAEAAIQLNLQTRNTGVSELVHGRRTLRLVAFNAVPHLEQPERAHAVTHS